MKQTPLETIPKEKIAEIKAWLAFQPRGESKDIAALVEKFEAPTAPAAPTPPAPAPAAPVGTLAERGRIVFEQTAGGVGCASCHGMDGAGDAGLSTPDIRGADEARVRSALTGVTLMSGIRLTEAELEAVLAHLQTLNLAP